MPTASKQLKQLLLFCFLMFFLQLIAVAQTTKVNELLGQLHKNDPDSVQIKILRKLSVAYSSVDPIKKFYYSNQYRILAEKHGIDSLVASAYLDMGNSHGLRSNLDSALYYFKIGQERAKASNFLSGVARSYVNMGFVYDRLDRKKEAVKYYEESLKIFRKLNHKKGINQCITNLGAIYFDLKEYKTAHQYFQQVLESVRETPDDEVGLSNAMYSLGGSSWRLGDNKKALEYYQKSLAIKEKIGDLNGIALNNWGMGQLLVDKKEYDQALYHLEIALKNNRALKNIYQECAVLLTVTDAYLGLKDYKKAEEAAKLALARGTETKSKIAKSLALKQLVKVKAAQKKFAAAALIQSNYIAVNDSLQTTETKKEVIINDLHRVNSDNKILERDNRTITSKNADYVIVIAIITILLIIVAVLLALYYKRNFEKKTINTLLQKQKQEIADVNEELGALNEELTTQMDIVSAQNIELEKLNTVKNKFFSIVSHDLRSPMITLKTLFELYRKGDLTENELSGLLARLEDTIYTTAAFLDNLLEWSKSQLEGIVVQRSFFNLHQIVANNIKLMDSQIKLKALQVANHIDPEIMVFADPNMINVVFRNLLSNSIKFCSAGDQVLFGATAGADDVVCTIQDSGPGISDAQQANLFNLTNTTSTGTAGEKGYHIGLILCKDMILQNNGRMELKSKLGEGTTFSITLSTVEPNQ